MKMLKTFAKYATGSLFALLAGLITTPILTRLIDTVEMGKYSMYITVGSLIASFLYIGLDQSYVRFYNDEEDSSRNYLLSKCLRYPLIATAVISATILIGFVPFSNMVIGTSSFAISVLMAMYLFGLVIDRFWLLKIRMVQKAGAYSALNVIRKLSYLFIAVGLYFTTTGNSCWSLIIAVTAAEGVLMAGAWAVERNNWNIESKELHTSTTELFKYGFPFVFSTTITLIFHSTDKLMLKALSDYNQIGLYSGAQNIVNLLTQVQTVFTTFWMPVAYEHYSNNKEDKKFFVKINQIVSYGMLVIAVMLFCFKDVVVLFLGYRYRDAVYVFPFLTFMPIMYTVSETTVMGINFMKKSSYHVWISVICAAVNAIGNYFLISRFGAKGAAISTGLSYVVFFILRTIFAERVYKVPFKLGRFGISCLLVCMLAVMASFLTVTIKYFICAIIVIVVISILYKDVLKIEMNFIVGYIKERR